MSQNDDTWTHFNVRCLTSLREEAEASAERQGQSFAEWIRRAMQEKLVREKTESSILSEEMKLLIEETVAKMIALEKKED